MIADFSLGITANKSRLYLNYLINRECTVCPPPKKGILGILKFAFEHFIWGSHFLGHTVLELSDFQNITCALQKPKFYNL